VVDRDRRWRDRVRAALAAGSVLGIGAIGTLAAWTDESTATTGTFSTGTIDLKLGSTPVDNNPAAFTTSFALTSIKPGDSKQATLQVDNSGTVPFTYTISGTATNNGAGANQLGNAMALQIYPTSDCSGTTVLNSSTDKFTFSATAPRALAAGANETLCFKATLPSNADTALQGQSTVGTFTFVATTS
jgi:predicted ribosomally synthesized peptide with SipW-like signal peptide